MEKYFERSDTFGVTGRTIGLSDSIIQDSGKFPGQLLTGKIYHYNFYIKDPRNYWVPTLYLSGANALIDREKLKCLGGFDEIFAPFYCEDTDLSIRAWRLGYRSYYEHSSICRHPVSATIRKFHLSSHIWIISHRNKLILHAIHLVGLTRIVWNFKVWITLIGRSLVFDWNYLRAFRLYRELKPEIVNSIKRFSAVCHNKPPSIDFNP